MKSKTHINPLSQTLNIQSGDVIAFVGAGGKTSLMLAIAEELIKSGKKVAITTTTKIGTTELPQEQLSELVIETESGELISKTKNIIDHGKIPVLASGRDKEHDRLLGIDTKTVDEIAIENKIEVLLIEADGARQKPFKIPIPHEPVVPECVTKLCIVVGLDAIGQDITEENFYNTTGMQELGAILGEPLTPHILRNLIFHQSGYLRFKSRNRKIFLILNKAEKIRDDLELQETVTELFHNDLEKILVTSTRQEPLVRAIPDNNYHRLTGIVLAAGMSSRFNGVKQLADIGGKSLLYHITKHALDSILGSVTVVLGHESDNIEKSLGDLIENERLSIVKNENYHLGLSTSLITGINYTKDNSDAVMIILGDQPNITTEILNKLITAYGNSNAKLCVPLIKTEQNTRLGNPVIFNQRLFPELFEINGDVGAREVVIRNLGYARKVDLDDEKSQFQINTPEDLKKYMKKLHEVN